MSNGGDRPPDECSAVGPCQEMRAALAGGTVLLISERPSFANGARLCGCPFCAAPLSPALVADWPWAALRAAGIV